MIKSLKLSSRAAGMTEAAKIARKIAATCNFESRVVALDIASAILDRAEKVLDEADAAAASEDKP